MFQKFICLPTSFLISDTLINVFIEYVSQTKAFIGLHWLFERVIQQLEDPSHCVISAEMAIYSV